MRLSPTLSIVVALLLFGLLTAPAVGRRPDGELRVEVVDADTQQPIAARMRLVDQRERDVPAAGWGLSRLGDHCYIEGEATLGLRVGAYRFAIDAGPEYRTQAGHFEITRHASDEKRVEPRRFATLADEGWVCADVQSARPAVDRPLITRVEALAHTPTVAVTWRDGGWDAFPRGTGPKATLGSSGLWRDERGVVWLIDPTDKLVATDIPVVSEPTVEFLKQARDAGWKVVAAASSFELPLWLAHGVVDGLLVIDGGAESPFLAEADEAGYRAQGTAFQGNQGRGRWGEHVWFQTLEAGFDLPPLAGSGSGLNEEPMGVGRTLVYTGKPGERRAPWWEAVAGGGVVVTNGPLLRPRAGGEPPGEAFPLDGSGRCELLVSLDLATRDKVEYLELIQNGKRAANVPLGDWVKEGGRLPEVVFREPGWLVVRAVTERSDRYQLALSGAWRVDSADGAPRVSRRACDFFVTWLNAAKARFSEKAADEYAVAAIYWQERRDEATAD
ncbi:MAG: hypothetical protein ACRCT8_16790 [Lacipirellulaceae bacterium]